MKAQQMILFAMILKNRNKFYILVFIFLGQLGYAQNELGIKVGTKGDNLFLGSKMPDGN